MAVVASCGRGMRAVKIVEGRWVKTIACVIIDIVSLMDLALSKIRRNMLRTFRLPIRLAIEDATRVVAAARRLVVKNRDPRVPSSMLNFHRKKKAIQDLEQISVKAW